MTKNNEKPAAATVYVVDDDDGMRRALDTLLSTVGYKTAVFSRPSEFLAHFNPDAPGCQVLDIRMPEMSGLGLQHQLNRMGSMLPVIFITGHGDVPTSVQAMKAGAVEFLTKPFKDDVLLQAVQDAIERSRVALHLDAEMRALRNCYESLTSRERQVMALVVAGLLNKQVGGELGISEITVKVHRGVVMRKMKARSLPDLVTMATRLEASSPNH